MARKKVNTLDARIAKAEKRRQAVGDLHDLREVLWSFITRLRDEIERAEALGQDELKVGHALIQASGVYIRATEAGELEGRIERLEAAAEIGNDTRSAA